MSETKMKISTLGPTHSRKKTAIIDANVNRVSEGLRVIEDYCRFYFQHETWSRRLATLRQDINRVEKNGVEQLSVRDTGSDMRARDLPRKRVNTYDVLKANFKRAEEGLRVLEEVTGDATYSNFRYDVYDLEKAIILYATKQAVKPGIYLISHDPDVLIQALDWDVSIIQLRNKDASVHKSVLLEQSKRVAEHAKKANIPFIVNDFVDICLLSGADGFHSGQDDLPIHELRQVLGDDKIIGRTTHDLNQGLDAQKQGADYVSVGPIWDTPSKPGRPGIGFDYLKQAHQLDIPFVAIGGVNNTNVEQVYLYQPKWVGLIRDVGHAPLIQKHVRNIAT